MRPFSVLNTRPRIGNISRRKDPPLRDEPPILEYHSAVADCRLQEWTYGITESIVQPLISLLLQSAAFKLGFRAFKHLAASAISRGCLVPGLYFFRGTRMALPRLVPRRTDVPIDSSSRGVSPSRIVPVTVHSRPLYRPVIQIKIHKRYATQAV